MLIGYAAYPQTFRLGGNTGKPNSYTGVDVENLTRGAFNAETLFQGNNFQCFAFQLLQNGLPDFLKGPLGKLNKAIDKVSTAFDPVFGAANCPTLGKYDQSLFNSYPGRKYNPQGQGYQLLEFDEGVILERT